MADGEMSLFSLVWMALTGMYLGTTTLSVYNLFYPPRCRGPGCLQPKMPPGAMVDVRAYAQKKKGTPLADLVIMQPE